MSVSGLRVLRGPDWRGGDTDGGEGHVGTVTELLGNHTVRVLWDMGQESTCSAGHDGKCELRVLDTAQIGVRHPETRCSDCRESDIWGMLWRCRDCTGCDLCPLCYSGDKHDPRHRFLRIDAQGTEGHPVPKRKTSVKHRSLGLFPGSKVTRGRDWQWGDQDGGQGSEGEVKGYENVSPDSSRNLLHVEWPSGDVNSYRVGFHGNVDLRCVEEEEGPCYYRDHLPGLDSDQITKLATAINNTLVKEELSETPGGKSCDYHTPSRMDNAPLSAHSHNPPESKASSVSESDTSTGKMLTECSASSSGRESKAPTVSESDTSTGKMLTECRASSSGSESKAPTVSESDTSTGKMLTECSASSSGSESKAPTVSESDTSTGKMLTECSASSSGSESKAPTVSESDTSTGKMLTECSASSSGSESKAPTVSESDTSTGKMLTECSASSSGSESKAPTVSESDTSTGKMLTECSASSRGSESRAPTVSESDTSTGKMLTECSASSRGSESKAPTVSKSDTSTGNLQGSKMLTECSASSRGSESRAPTVSESDTSTGNLQGSKMLTECSASSRGSESRAPTVSESNTSTGNLQGSKMLTECSASSRGSESRAPTVSESNTSTGNLQGSKMLTECRASSRGSESKAPTVSESDTSTVNPQGSKMLSECSASSRGSESKAPTVSESDTSTVNPQGSKMLTECRASSRGSDDGPTASAEEIEEVSRSEGNKTREEITSADGDALTPGARVAVRVGVEKLLQLQQQCGADTEDLKRVLGKTGHVTGITDNGSVTVKFLTDDVIMNAKALVTVRECHPGDRVRLRDNVDDVKVLNCRVGWKDGMDKTAGKVGQVLTVDSEGDLLVSFGRHHFLFAPASCTHVTSDTPVDSLKLDGARMKKPGPNRSGVRIDINDNAGESKALFKDLRDTVRSDSSGRPSRVLTLTSDLHPGRLLNAAQRGDHHTVREMCTANRVLMEYELQRTTPLILACIHGHRQVVRVLLDLGADVNHGLSATNYPLMGTLRSPKKDEEIVMLLLENGADPFGLDEKRHTHIHIAASRSMPRAVQALADRGVDVNALDEYCDTALHLAIGKPSYDVIEVLLAVPGLDFAVRDANDLPVLHYACSRENARAVELILDRDKSQVNEVRHRYTPLHFAAHDDQDDCVRLLVLKGGADVNRGRHPPLSLACVRGMYRAAEALMELGADIQARDVNGQTPLHKVVSGRRVEDRFGPQSDQEIQVRVALACLLVSNGALVDAEDWKGRTPLACGDPVLREGVESFIRKNPELVRRQSGGTQGL
ncbi:serine-rich adhesin for platelets-like [Littorina saxatilis]|uniref:RING-type E3 ubiquitin transferase n=1 Tax=Littorina saxatilis TaxID=31220 RepID=A0AAN9AV94_9CAEN